MMTAPQLSRQIAASLPASVEAVIGPDHPYLLTGPDLLIADDDGLVAVFVEHSAEMRRPSLLKARQIMSTLALPSHVRFVTIARSGRQINPVDWDLVVDFESPRATATALIRCEARRRDTPRDVRSMAYERAGSIMLGDDPVPESLEGVAHRYREYAETSRIVSLDSFGLSSDASGLTLAGATSRLIAAINVSVTADFTVDMGAVYPVGLPGRHLLTLDPNVNLTRRFDPLKIWRSGALAGWALAGLPGTEFATDEPLDQTPEFDDE